MLELPDLKFLPPHLSLSLFYNLESLLSLKFLEITSGRRTKRKVKKTSKKSIRLNSKKLLRLKRLKRKLLKRLRRKKLNNKQRRPKKMKNGSRNKN